MRHRIASRDTEEGTPHTPKTDDIVAALNTLLTHELTAINQYFMHARILNSWGVSKLDDHEYKESIEEMKHADQIIKRILLLKGLPNLQDLHHVHIGQDVKEMLEIDLELERAGLPHLRGAIGVCETANDYVTRDMLSELLEETEEHADWLQAQLDLTKTVGLEN